MEVFSSVLFDTLDSIGYSKEVIKLRRNLWQIYTDVQKSGNQEGLTYEIIVGSKAEGFTSFFQSDVDLLSLCTKVVCTDNVAQLPGITDMAVIQTETNEAPPGYTRLKIVRFGGFGAAELNDIAFESESNEIYLSSSLFANTMKHSFMQFEGECHYFNVLSGPAVQAKASIIPVDVVRGIPCYYPHLLQSWNSRQRLHEWPPVQIREAAVSMLAEIVPIGSKGSSDQWREWRFCFIESELKLTYSLNETQLKLYITLKMVAKEILRQVSDEISSYIMKNVVYWLSELLPLAAFSSENLFTLVLLSLRFLKSAITEWNWFPYYMIPGRNLLAERLTPVNRRQLSGLLETLIQEGPLLFLRSTKLRTALNVRLQAPALLSRFRERRDRLELLTSKLCVLKLQNADESDLDTLTIEMWDTVLPEWRMMWKLGIVAVHKIYVEKLLAMLS